MTSQSLDQDQKITLDSHFMSKLQYKFIKKHLEYIFQFINLVIINNMLKLTNLRFCISKVVERNAKFAKQAKRIQKKLKDVRQTVGDAEALQKYVKERSKEEIAGKIDQMSRNQQELRDYINKFNSDHKNRINILDLSNYVREYKDLNQPGLKKHQLEMLQEFRKRRMDIKSQNMMSQLNQGKQHDSGEEGFQDVEHLTKQLSEFTLNPDKAEKQQNSQEEQKFNNLDIQVSKGTGDGYDFQKLFQVNPQNNKNIQQRSMYRQGVFDIYDQFIMLILDRDSTTKVTTLNRINTCRTIVFMGNGTGLMSYGRGRGISHKEALKRAIYHCKKNIIAIPIDPALNVPEKLYAHFQDYKVTLRPARVFNPWGHPVFATMLSVAGIYDCAFKTVHTDKNQYNVVNSLFKVATKNKTPQQISQKQGRKIYRKQWIKPIPFRAAQQFKAILH